MANLLIIPIVILGLAGPVSATPLWDFSWSSFLEVGHLVDPDTGHCCDSVRTTLSGTSTATLSAFDHRLAIDFPTIAGPGHLEIETTGIGAFKLSHNSSIPLDVPLELGGLFGPTGGATGVVLAFDELLTADYRWSDGPFSSPPTFNVVVGHQGSTVDPTWRLSGAGTRRSVAAEEPGVLALIGLAAIAMLARLRRWRGAGAGP